MLQLSLDPGINAVFQFQHGRQRKLHLCVTRRGAFPAWCVWSTHVQSRVFSRPDPRGGWNLARGREKKAGADQGEIICPKKELLFGELQTDRRLTDGGFSAYAPLPRLAPQNAVRGEATATDVTGFRPRPFSTLPVLYTTPPWPLPPPNGCTWLTFASSCTCSASFQNVSFKLLRYMLNMIYSS